MLYRRIGIGLLVVALLGGGWFLTQRGGTADPGTGEYSTAAADRGDITQTITETGTVSGADSRRVSAAASGTVSEIHIEQGDRVDAGTPLITLENEQLTLELEQARLDLESARESLADLLGVPASEALSSQVHTGFRITAGQPGRIQELLVQPGQQVDAGTPAARLVDDRRLLFVARVGPTEVGDIRAGQPASVRADDFAPQYLEGQVTAVDREGYAEEGVRRHDVTIAVDNPGALEAGMSGDARLEGGGDTIQAVGSYRLPPARTVAATRPGRIDDVTVDPGDWVEAGEAVAVGSNEDVTLDVRRQQLQAEQAQLALEDAEERLAELEVTAPIAGVVRSVDVLEGDEVAAGTAGQASPLVTIADLETLQVVIPIGESDIRHVEIGQPASVQSDALPEQEFDGDVTEVATFGTNEGGITTFDVTVELDAAGRGDTAQLRPGMNADVELTVDGRTDVLRVPSEAVTVTDDESRGTVEIIVDGTPETRQVEIGLRTARWTEITGGLEAGQEVVTARAEEPSNIFAPPEGGGPGGPEGPGDADGPEADGSDADGADPTDDGADR